MASYCILHSYLCVAEQRSNGGIRKIFSSLNPVPGFIMLFKPQMLYQWSYLMSLTIGLALKYLFWFLRLSKKLVKSSLKPTASLTFLVVWNSGCFMTDPAFQSIATGFYSFKGLQVFSTWLYYHSKMSESIPKQLVPTQKRYTLVYWSLNKPFTKV